MQKTMGKKGCSVAGTGFLQSGVTRGWSQGENLAEGGPLATV